MKRTPLRSFVVASLLSVERPTECTLKEISLYKYAHEICYTRSVRACENSIKGDRTKLSESIARIDTDSTGPRTDGPFGIRLRFESFPFATTDMDNAIHRNEKI